MEPQQLLQRLFPYVAAVDDHGRPPEKIRLVHDVVRDNVPKQRRRNPYAYDREKSEEEKLQLQRWSHGGSF
ncbi:hypothetical protein SCP_0405050 [Sparassis crispa]|uniref:Uncharacterized protein n=1 Tax=Sparassis crispa TaxID=139825 RepID=A0A401GJ45_9APHY|nr:hypothetical protein SCP_0405050 [Sparassis crispa]GBE82125.1 hypothetical protein SCP_0405050 [Sparassis crispa]